MDEESRCAETSGNEDSAGDNEIRLKSRVRPPEKAHEATISSVDREEAERAIVYRHYIPNDKDHSWRALCPGLCIIEWVCHGVSDEAHVGLYIRAGGHVDE